MSKRSRKQQQKAKLAELAEQDAPIRALHAKLFPEEYDFHYDSNVEANLRRKGVNPMSEEYQREVNQRRLSMGVKPYMGSVGVESIEGLVTSWEYCQFVLDKQNKTNEKNTSKGSDN